MSGISSGLGIGASALNTHAWGMAVTAHNIANVSTDGFEPQRAHYASGPHGEGVRLNAVSQGNGLGQASALASRNGADTLNAAMSPEIAAPSGTDLARATVSMMTTEHGYAANAVTIRTIDDMMGTVLDIKA